MERTKGVTVAWQLVTAEVCSFPILEARMTAALLQGCTPPFVSLKRALIGFYTNDGTSISEGCVAKAPLSLNSVF